MSNYLAIATVTAALRQLLQEAATIVPGAVVTSLRPRGTENGGHEKAGVNLYMYQTMPNAAWRNSDVVRRRPDPRDPDNRGKDMVEQRPQVPLNLYYLLSFYGNELELEPQRLLGSVVGALQSTPMLTPQFARDIAQRFSYLAHSDLDFQLENIERVRLTPITLNLEELSKLWSVFFQVPYALSIAYEAAVVLIEPGSHRRVPVVRERSISTEQKADSAQEAT